MSNVNSRLTVYFEEPYWIGVFEHIEDGKLTATKVVFGAEPKDYEVYEFVLRHFYGLTFSPAVADADVVKKEKKNPKRIQREVRKQLQNTGIGTKSQQALKLQHEKNKKEGRARQHERKKAETLRLFEMKQQKKKRKHKGH